MTNLKNGCIINVFHLVHKQGCNMNLFSGISPEEIEKIVSKSQTAIKDKGDELYKKGFIGIIVKGNANVVRTGSGGKSVTIRSIATDDVFGAASLFGDWDENFSSIKAETKCEILYFSEKMFCELLKSYPRLSVNYIMFLTDRIRFLNRRLDTFCAGTTQNKLYEFLISQSDDNGSVNLKISMSELANRLKIGRTSLYRDISSLEKSNLIVRNGKKFIII